MRTEPASCPATIQDITDDTLLGGRLRLFQPGSGYRVAIDPVLLAAAVPAGAGDSVLDAGIGSGAAALCLAHRVRRCLVVGIERQPAFSALARANVAANRMEGRIELVEGDLADAGGGLAGRSFDQVMSNPPFLEAEVGTPPPDPLRRAANVAGMPIAAWIAACLRRLRPGGTLTLIHRADRVDAVLAALTGAAGGTAIAPLWPRADAAQARRVIVRAIKGSRAPCRIVRGLVLHDRDGHLTAAADAILRDGAALQF